MLCAALVRIRQVINHNLTEFDRCSVFRPHHTVNAAPYNNKSDDRALRGGLALRSHAGRTRRAPARAHARMCEHTTRAHQQRRTYFPGKSSAMNKAHSCFPERSRILAAEEDLLIHLLPRKESVESFLSERSHAPFSSLESLLPERSRAPLYRPERNRAPSCLPERRHRVSHCRLPS